jgi:hypothetical protein
LDIRKPLMRGVTIHIGENMLPKWCPFEYEYLPDFCFTCGIIGHGDRRCVIKLKRGEQQQFVKWLKAAIPKKEFANSSYRWYDDRGGSGQRRPLIYGFRNQYKRSGSDSDSWRKDGVERRSSLASGGEDVEKSASEKEVSSPLKLPPPPAEQGGSQRRLEFLDTHVEEDGKDNQLGEHQLGSKEEDSGPKASRSREAQHGGAS